MACRIYRFVKFNASILSATYISALMTTADDYEVGIMQVDLKPAVICMISEALDVIIPENTILKNLPKDELFTQIDTAIRLLCPAKQIEFVKMWCNETDQPPPIEIKQITVAEPLKRTTVAKPLKQTAKPIICQYDEPAMVRPQITVKSHNEPAMVRPPKREDDRCSIQKLVKPSDKAPIGPRIKPQEKCTHCSKAHIVAKSQTKPTDHIVAKSQTKPTDHIVAKPTVAKPNNDYAGPTEVKLPTIAYEFHNDELFEQCEDFNANKLSDECDEWAMEFPDRDDECFQPPKPP
jgi:hypothetical protein